MPNTIEQNLERIANALETLAKAAGNFNFTQVGDIKVATTTPANEEAAKKAAAKKLADEAAAKKLADEAAAKKLADEAAAKTKADEEKAAAKALGGKPKTSKDDVRKALQAYREIEGTQAMLDILKKAGATTLNDLAEDKYEAVVAAVS